MRGEGGLDGRPQLGQALEVLAAPSLAHLGGVAVGVEERAADRRPQAGVATARAVASGCQYMSQKRVVPVRIISAQARRVPQ